MTKPDQTYSFFFDLPEVSNLFAKWLPLYVGQAKMDDDDAEPFQKPLQDFEHAIDGSPITTMQDLFHIVAAGTCLGTMACDFGPERLEEIYAVAKSEDKERELLVALIAEHQTALNKFKQVLAQHEDHTPEFEEEGGCAARDKEGELLMQIASMPMRSIDNMAVKGRYLAALRASHDLGYEHAEAFVDSFAAIGRASA